MNNKNNGHFLNVKSEIGNLKAVLLHKPGHELEKLTPDLLKELLFDDIPWLKQMRLEHDKFADLLRGRGTEVYYVEELLAEVLENNEVKIEFINDLLDDSRIQNPKLREMLYEYIIQKTALEIAQVSIAGIDKKEINKSHREDSLWDFVNKDYPLYINPVPNLYFMRDPAAIIGNGISINSMQTETRRREPKLIKYIYDYNPLFKKQNSPLWFDYKIPYNIEGGDILVLSKEVVAIGCSERTSAIAIETIARTLFENDQDIKEVLAIQIPPLRAFMHLDTVFTMVDYDKFLIYPGIQDKVKVYKLSRNGSGGVKVNQEHDLLTTLKQSLKIPAVQLIQSGGGDAITAAREQWNDSTNTLAIAPGTVVTYSRNEISNETLRKNGIEVLEIDGSELVRGRGGPRCMSCPLVREDL
jgi:arginine deiminase